MSGPILEISKVTQFYSGGGRALNNVSITINTGEFVAILGRSGSGKSSLLRTITGFNKNSSGTVNFQGQNIAQLDRQAIRSLRHQIGTVFQEHALIDRYSALDNVLIGILFQKSWWDSLLHRFTAEERSRAKECLKIVGLKWKEDKRVDKLSLGQRQRVAIARILMQNPKLLLADELVASLDQANSDVIMQCLMKLNKTFGMTIICNLHNLALAKKYASRIVVMRAGEIIYDGVSSEISEEWFKGYYGYKT